MTLYKDWFAQYSALIRCHRVWVIQIQRTPIIHEGQLSCWVRLWFTSMARRIRYTWWG